MHSDKLVSVPVCVWLCTTKVSKRNTHKQISKDCGEAINNMIYALHKLFTFIFMHFVVVAHMPKPVCMCALVYVCVCEGVTFVYACFCPIQRFLHVFVYYIQCVSVCVLCLYSHWC